MALLDGAADTRKVEHPRVGVGELLDGPRMRPEPVLFGRRLAHRVDGNERDALAAPGEGDDIVGHSPLSHLPDPSGHGELGRQVPGDSDDTRRNGVNQHEVRGSSDPAGLAPARRTRLRGRLAGPLALCLGPPTPGPIDLRWDASTYYVLGSSLAQGKGYRLLNEPGEIEAIQYPPLVPLIVAAHQRVLGTSDPLKVGSWWR